METIEQEIQRTQEWLQSRCGYVTASNFSAVMDFNRSGKESSKRRSYMMKVVTERLTGIPSNNYMSTAMQWGTDKEGMARRAYMGSTSTEVKEVAFIKHPKIEWVGGSPDGLIGDKGGIEIKCPFESANHLESIMTGMSEDHMPQIQGNIWISDLEWIDFISYDPRMPAEYQMYIQRVNRDDIFIIKMKEHILKFIDEIDQILGRLSGILEGKNQLIRG